MEQPFDLAIREHLELQRRNRLLEERLPIATYRGTPARSTVLEDTQEWTLPESPAVLDHDRLFPAAEDLWTGTPTFDWGD